VDATRFEAADEKVLKKMLFKRMRVVRWRERRDALAALREDVNPDGVTEDYGVQRSVEIRRRLEREVETVHLRLRLVFANVVRPVGIAPRATTSHALDRGLQCHRSVSGTFATAQLRRLMNRAVLVKE
jgi:hypothetical protein